MTCNPNWPEIQGSLYPGQEPYDRPDIVARVFRLKLTHLIEDLVKQDIVGKVTARIHVVEFQKRGLPHAHILVILSENDRLKNADEEDQIISAELPPDPSDYPEGCQREQAERLLDAAVNQMTNSCSSICRQGQEHGKCN